MAYILSVTQRSVILIFKAMEIKQGHILEACDLFNKSFLELDENKLKRFIINRRKSKS